MTDDQNIDNILAGLYKASPGALYVAEFTRRELGLDDYAYPKYVDRLEALGLATPLDPRQRMSITDLGRQMVEQGGWIAHKSKNDAEKERKEEKEALELELAKSYIEANRLNHRNARFNKWSTWANIMIGLVNLAVAAAGAFDK